MDDFEALEARKQYEQRYAALQAQSRRYALFGRICIVIGSLSITVQIALDVITWACSCR